MLRFFFLNLHRHVPIPFIHVLKWTKSWWLCRSHSAFVSTIIMIGLLIHIIHVSILVKITAGAQICPVSVSQIPLLLVIFGLSNIIL